MKRVGTIAVCLAGGLVLNTSLRADDDVLPGNPYSVVVKRNVFGLNPPPPPVDPNATVVEPPVKIVPNGIMSIFGQLQVLFKVAGKPPAKDASYILMEGQSQDEIEVVKIDEKAGIVTFNNHGIPQELPLVVTPPTAPASVPTGGNPGFPGIAPGGGATPAAGTTGNNPFMNRFGNRGGQSGVRPSGGINPSGNGGPGFGGNATRGATANETPALSAEEQTIMLAAQHAKLQQEGNPAAAIFPPTVIDADAGVIPTPSAGGPPGPGGATGK
jgi:hypothetical protein